ncbi:hypothetical protein V6Z92_001720 [Aspergillus fumigatus]
MDGAPLLNAASATTTGRVTFSYFLMVNSNAAFHKSEPLSGGGIRLSTIIISQGLSNRRENADNGRQASMIHVALEGTIKLGSRKVLPGNQKWHCPHAQTGRIGVV